MNRDYIMNLPAGKELNNLVTHEIMGNENNWSESISAAWEVADKFETIEVKRFITDKGYWFCEIKRKVWHRSYGKTAPEAICKAALLAVMEGGERE